LKKKPKIFFRADGNSNIGLGHVMRSLALAEMIKDHFDSCFIIRSPSPAIQEKIKNVCDKLILLDEKTNIADNAQLLTLSNFHQNAIVVLDGYAFDTKYQKEIKKSGAKIICIDDINAYHFFADVVINHSGGFEIEEYSVEPNTKVYLGPQFALIRPEFQKAAQHKNLSEINKNIFVCFGGADPKNDTLSALQKCIKHSSDSSYFVVLGSAYLHGDKLSEFIEDTTTEINISTNLDAQQMVALMSKCSTAITSPSTVSYEYLSTRGRLFVKVIADNQKRINAFLINSNLAFNFDNFPNPVDIKDTIELQNSIFDGAQKKRFLKILFDLVMDIALANEKDIQLYFDWANDPLVRTLSFNNNPIPWENHQKWFTNKIHSRDHIFYKAVIIENAVGQIRYDLKEDEALINYSVDSNFRGYGIGSLMIEKTLLLIDKKFKTDYSIIGFVKYGNVASSMVFRKLGFEEFESIEFEETYKYVLKCKK
jgi:UDP-2,4-diacetamido-2,4,6-trideoxy-beta-L-altropyranose hydrolase